MPFNSNAYKVYNIYLIYAILCGITICSPVTTGKKEALHNMFIYKQLQRAFKNSLSWTRCATG